MHRRTITILTIGTLLLLTSGVYAQDEEACCLPDGICVVITVERCLDIGGTPMGALSCADVICDEPTDYAIEFSVDIGSDAELSDPFRDGDEGFDPGDVYWWLSAPVAFPGRDGFKDDSFIFGWDPFPDAPDSAYGTAVPVGNGASEEMYYDFFDLDGHDQISISLVELQWIGREPLEIPIPEFDSPCIYEPKFVFVSIDDDQAPGWPWGDVPVTVPSMMGYTYGRTAGADEVIGVTLAPGGGYPYPVGNMYPVADEVGVHTSLRPNPDNKEEDDDDVDSLDIVRDAEICPFWYFSADHEAHLGLDPGGIYEVMGGTPIQVIDEIHLGIPEETDIDAFEFCFAEHPQEPGFLAFGIIFSVDEDDPITGGDESGGFIPGALYISWFQGWSMQLTHPLAEEDDIDAVMLWSNELPPAQTTPCPNPGSSGQYCTADLNGDCVITLADLQLLLATYGLCPGDIGYLPAADLTADGNPCIGLADLQILLSQYGDNCN